LCGGGVHNQTLVKLIQKVLPEMTVRFADELGCDNDTLEAACMAYLAARRLQDKPSTFPNTTGVSAPMVAGDIYDC